MFFVTEKCYNNIFVLKWNIIIVIRGHWALGNEMNRALGHYVHIQAELGLENLLRMVRWDDTVLQTQDSNFKPWRSEAEYATFRSISACTHVDLA